MTWQDDAACAGLDPWEADDLFFSGTENELIARRMCSECPVLAQCRADGDRVENGAYWIHGYRAGESPDARRKRRRNVIDQGRIRGVA